MHACYTLNTYTTHHSQHRHKHAQTDRQTDGHTQKRRTDNEAGGVVWWRPIKSMSSKTCANISREKLIENHHEHRVCGVRELTTSPPRTRNTFVATVARFRSEIDKSREQKAFFTSRLIDVQKPAYQKNHPFCFHGFSSVLEGNVQFIRFRESMGNTHRILCVHSEEQRHLDDLTGHPVPFSFVIYPGRTTTKIFSEISKDDGSEKYFSRTVPRTTCFLEHIRRH